MKKMVINIISIIVLLIMVSGCAGINGHFGCDAKASTSCMSITQVNARANAGKFNDEARRGGRMQLPLRNKNFHYLGSRAIDQGVTPMLGEPVRTQGRIQRIWIAPYQDFENNYHEPSYVYTVLEKPHWLGRPAKEIQTSETMQDDGI